MSAKAKNGNGHAAVPQGFVLTVANTVNSQSLAALLGIPGALVRPGTEIPSGIWPKLRNLSSMISAGTLQWRPPQYLAPVIAKAAPVRSVPVRLPEYIRKLAIVIDIERDRRKCSWSEAEDHVISTIEGEKLWKSATAEFVSKPRTVTLGNGTVVRTGAGSHGGRSVRGFREYLAQGGR